MSRDDDDNYTINYRQTFPVSTRNRKRRTESKSQGKEPVASRFSPKDVQKKVSEPHSKSSRHYRDAMDERPTRSMTAVAQEMLAKNLDLRVDDVMERLERLGYEAAPITISSIRQDMMKILRLCEKHGSIIVPAWRD